MVSSVKAIGIEPQKAATPELVSVTHTTELVKTPSTKSPNASTPEPLITPEPKASSNKPEKAPAIEPIKDSAFNAEVLRLKATSFATNKDKRTSEILSVRSDMEVIGTIEKLAQLIGTIEEDR